MRTRIRASESVWVRMRACASARTHTRALKIFLSHVYFRIIFWLFKYIFNILFILYTCVLYYYVFMKSNRKTKSQQINRKRYFNELSIAAATTTTTTVATVRQKMQNSLLLYFAIPFDSWVLKCNVNIEFLCDHLNCLCNVRMMLFMPFPLSSRTFQLWLSPSRCQQLTHFWE